VQTLSSPWQKSSVPESGPFGPALCWRDSPNLPRIRLVSPPRPDPKFRASGSSALSPRAARQKTRDGLMRRGDAQRPAPASTTFCNDRVA
jgi:hypothetical protein